MISGSLLVVSSRESAFKISKLLCSVFFFFFPFKKLNFLFILAVPGLQGYSFV